MSIKKKKLINFGKVKQLLLSNKQEFTADTLNNRAFAKHFAKLINPDIL